MRPFTEYEFEGRSRAVLEASAARSLDAEARALLELRATIYAALRETISDMRTKGASWQQVADAVGTTRQGACKTYGG